MSSRETNIKEKFKIALTSTAKVISGDLSLNDKNSDNKKSKDLSSIEIDDLTNPSDFVRLRAETDSSALKKNFLMMQYIKKIYQLILHPDLFIILLKKLDMSLLGGKCLKE